jgi:hypothetical protein
VIGVKTPTGNATVANASILTAGGAKAIARMGILTADGAKDFFTTGGTGTLTVDVSPISAIGSGFSNSTVTVTTNLVTATASGGTAPYTYAWTRVSGATGFTATSPSQAASRFAIDLAMNDNADATFRVTATDARGRTGTADVPAAAFNYGAFP